MNNDYRRSTAAHGLRASTFVFCLWSMVFSLWSPLIYAAPEDELLKKSGVQHQLGKLAALDTAWTTSDGKKVLLNQFFTGKPVILVPVYYTCPMLCQLVLKGLAKGLKQLDMVEGGVYDLVIYSINPKDSSTTSLPKKNNFLKDLGQNKHARSVTFLTGEEKSIRILSKSIGFQFEKDPASGEYVHSAMLLFLSPEGQIMRYMGGIDFNPRDVKLALIEASSGKVGSFWEQILLVCYHYNPSKGKYSMAVDRILKIFGGLTVLCLVLFIWRCLKDEKIGKGRPDVSDTPKIL